jgi:hypothetical protein
MSASSQSRPGLLGSRASTSVQPPLLRRVAVPAGWPVAVRRQIDVGNMSENYSALLNSPVIDDQAAINAGFDL